MLQDLEVTLYQIHLDGGTTTRSSLRGLGGKNFMDKNLYFRGF
jgi:hypothetical protein